MKDLKELVKSFYTKCLTVNKAENPSEILDSLLDENFLSINTMESKNKKVLIGQISYFWKLIPDLKWEPQEILQDGNRVIVRSIATGTPNSEFMGLKLDGNKSFKIMSIDIHTVENEKIKNIYHIEEWATAINQMR